VVLVVLYLSMAVVLSVISTNPRLPHCQKRHTIYISSNGVHLDLIIPSELLNKDLLQELKPPYWASHIAFGWGDKEFYINTPQWEDLKPSIAFRALFTNSQSAIHVVWIPSQQGNWSQVSLCDEQLLLLNQYIDSAFKKGAGGGIQEINAAGYTDRDKFYLANGSFNGINTCNQWVNKALKQAQVQTSVWSPFDKGVLYQVGKVEGQVRGSGVRGTWEQSTVFSLLSTLTADWLQLHILLIFTTFR